MNELSNVFCQAGIYTCTTCGHTAEMYSDEEWLSENTDTSDTLIPKVCVTCGKMHVPFFDPCLLFRADVIDPDDGYPFHPKPASIPDNKINICKECLGVDKMHWTAKEMDCKRCDTETMQFTSYVPGTHIDVFREYVTRLANAEPTQSIVYYYDEDGNECDPPKPFSEETKMLFRHLQGLQKQLCEQGNIYSIETLYDDIPLRTYLIARVCNEFGIAAWQLF